MQPAMATAAQPCHFERFGVVRVVPVHGREPVAFGTVLRPPEFTALDCFQHQTPGFLSFRVHNAFKHIIAKVKSLAHGFYAVSLQHVEQLKAEHIGSHSAIKPRTPISVNHFVSGCGTF